MVVSFPVPLDFEITDIQGSGGGGTIVNGEFRYEVGSLANGASTEIQFNLVARKPGIVAWAQPAKLAVGDGLVDPSPLGNSLTLPELEVIDPGLAAELNAGVVQLRWQSPRPPTLFSKKLLLLDQGASGHRLLLCPRTHPKARCSSSLRLDRDNGSTDSTSSSHATRQGVGKAHQSAPIAN